MNWTIAGLVLATLVGSGGIGGLVIFFRPKRAAGVREVELINELQQERDSDRQRIQRLEVRANASFRRERLRDDYIMVLRQHIADGKPPPPPPFPASLLEVES